MVWYPKIIAASYLVIKELVSEVPKIRFSKFWLVDISVISFVCEYPPQENAERCSHYNSINIRPCPQKTQWFLAKKWANKMSKIKLYRARTHSRARKEIQNGWRHRMDPSICFFGRTSSRPHYTQTFKRGHQTCIAGSTATLLNWMGRFCGWAVKMVYYSQTLTFGWMRAIVWRASSSEYEGPRAPDATSTGDET